MVKRGDKMAGAKNQITKEINGTFGRPRPQRVVCLGAARRSAHFFFLAAFFFGAFFLAAFFFGAFFLVAFFLAAFFLVAFFFGAFFFVAFFFCGRVTERV